MKKQFLLNCLLLLLPLSHALAQSRTVSGVVRSVSDKQTIPGVNVTVKGTTEGTITDIDGRYSLNVPDGRDTLIFSFVGYLTGEANIGNRSVIDVSLAEDIRQLSDVVVVGYGTQERRDLTGAIGSASSEVIENIPVTNALQAIQGQIAGVQVATASGRPGSGVQVRVRGRASLGGVGANDPLYVVDGVPISNADDSQLTAGQGVSPIANINPEDIESIEVLKDASAAAIYGSRASMG